MDLVTGINAETTGSREEAGTSRGWAAVASTQDLTVGATAKGLAGSFNHARTREGSSNDTLLRIVAVTGSDRHQATIAMKGRRTADTATNNTGTGLPAADVVVGARGRGSTPSAGSTSIRRTRGTRIRTHGTTEHRGAACRFNTRCSRDTTSRCTGALTRRWDSRAGGGLEWATPGPCPLVMRRRTAN